MDPLDNTAALKVLLEPMLGAVVEPMTAARGLKPSVLIYRIMGKMFAILSFCAEQS
jgi:hypothetical protein